jgi:cysteine desulfurase
VKRDEALHVAEPMIRGGGQERGSRAGTENVAAIAALGAAAAECRTSLAVEAAHMEALRERLEAGMHAITPEAIIFGADTERLPNTTLVAMPGGKAETLVIGFDLDGVAVSSGAACSSGKVAPSHVLAAMGCTGGTRARRDPRQPGPDDHRGRNRPLSECLAKAHEIPI